MEVPKILEGGNYSDERGNLFFNNNFNATHVKRIYYIENINVDFIRGWTGHKIEQRWFSTLQGSFTIKLIKIDNWETPSANSEILNFEISSEKMNVLHVPKGYASAIQSREESSRLLVMGDYLLGEINDDYRFPIDYFKNLK
jgi:dTDP-4-dehydrorhamnose 3,5-epimerase-like enzyme